VEEFATRRPRTTGRVARRAGSVLRFGGELVSIRYDAVIDVE
jgi:hypothetical protein